MIKIILYLIYLMLTLKRKPFNPNRKASVGPIWDQKDVQLTLDNLNSIPTKDIKVTGKSLEFYKQANKLDTIAEIITTWNLSQYNILSGVRDVLNSTDRILKLTEGRNKLIGKCSQQLKFYRERSKRIEFLLVKASDALPDVVLNDYKSYQKRKNIWTFSSCQDAMFTEDELKDDIFYNLEIEENIKIVQMNEQTNNFKINKKKKLQQSIIGGTKYQSNEIIVQESNGIDTIKPTATITHDILNANPRQVIIINNEPQMTQHLTDRKPLENIIKAIKKEPQLKTQIEANLLANKPLKSNAKIKLKKNKNLNLKQKKSVKGKRKKKKKKRKQKIIKKPKKLAHTIGRTIEMDREMLIEQAKYQAACNEWSFG